MKKLVLITALILEVFFQVREGRFNLVKSCDLTLCNTSITHYSNFDSDSKELFKVTIGFSGGSSLGFTYYFSKNIDDIDFDDMKFSLITLTEKDKA